MDTGTTKHSLLPHSLPRPTRPTTSAQILLPLSLNEENLNHNLDNGFGDWNHTNTYNPTSLRSPSPYSSDPEFSAEFSPESLTRENASSTFHHYRAGWSGIPQLWQDLACVPFQEDEIVGFRMGVNTCLSVADLGVNTCRGEGMEVGSALGTADEAFWIKSTTRRPAPGTEWEFERVRCAGKGKEKEGFTWGGQGEGGIEGEGDRSEERSGRGRKEIAVERLKNVLAHLET